MNFSFIFGSGVPLGGVETSSLRLARAMVQAGHNVHLFIHGEECHPVLRDLVHSFEHTMLPNIEDATEEHILEAYAKQSPSVFFPNQSVEAYPLLRKLKTRVSGARVAGICHSDHEDYYALAVDMQDVVDVQFGVSELICAQLSGQLQREPKLIILGVDVPEMYPERRPHKKLKLLYTGRLENYGKRCSELIPAGEALKKRGVPIHMTMAGDGPYRKWLLDDLKQVPWWRRGGYDLLGPLPPGQLAGLYQQSDIYLSFTRFEGNSIAVMEAMAHGCVPVVPRVSGTETVITHGENGWLGDVDRPETLIEACWELHEDRALLEAMSRKAHGFAGAHCNIKDTVQYVEECFKEFV